MLISFNEDLITEPIIGKQWSIITYVGPEKIVVDVTITLGDEDPFSFVFSSKAKALPGNWEQAVRNFYMNHPKWRLYFLF